MARARPIPDPAPVMAATRPVYPDQPDRPENRRITIVLLADKSALPQDSDFAR